MQSIQELDRSYLAQRCEILNHFLEEEISFKKAKKWLKKLDFKFEVLTDIASLPELPAPKPFNWED